MVEGISIRDGLPDDGRALLVALGALGGGHQLVRADQVIARVMEELERPLDGSFYEQLIALARVDRSRHLLVQGRGNLGSAEDPPADPEYVSVKLTPLGCAVVDLATGSRTARPVPVVLMNGTMPFGGSLPGHNLTRVVAASLLILADPAIGDDVVGAVLGPPDFGAGGVVVTGFDTMGDEQASVVMRAGVQVRRDPGGGLQVTVSDLAPTVDQLQVLGDVREIVDQVPELRVAREGLFAVGGQTWILPGSAVTVQVNDRAGQRSFTITTQGGDSTQIEQRLRDGLPLEVTVDVSVDLAGGPRTRGALVRRWVDDALDVLAEQALRDQEKIQERRDGVDAARRLVEHPDVVAALTGRDEHARATALASITGPPVGLSEAQSRAIAAMHPASLRRPSADEDLRYERATLDDAQRVVNSIVSRGPAARELLAAHLETLPAAFGERRRSRIQPDPDLPDEI